MDGAFGARRREKSLFINVTSLVDIILVLLIFVLSTTSFRMHTGIDVRLPQAATGGDQEHPKYEVTVTSAGAIFFGDRQMDKPQLRDTLSALLKTEPNAPIYLRADKAASFQDVIGVIDVAREAGGAQLILPTQPLNSSK
jgi:biopolymer transport protein ExbD